MAVQLQETRISRPFPVQSPSRAVPPRTILGALQWLAAGNGRVRVCEMSADGSHDTGSIVYPFNVLLRDRLIAVDDEGDCSYFRMTCEGRGMIAAVHSLAP